MGSCCSCCVYPPELHTYTMCALKPGHHFRCVHEPPHAPTPTFIPTATPSRPRSHILHACLRVPLPPCGARAGLYTALVKLQTNAGKQEGGTTQSTMQMLPVTEAEEEDAEVRASFSRTHGSARAH